MTGTGSARADEVVRLLGLADLTDAGAVLERTTVEIRDEVSPPADPADRPPDGPARTRPPQYTPAARPAADAEILPAAAEWGLSPNGPVVE